MNLYEYYRRQVRAQPDAVAIHRAEETDITFADLDQQARQVAAWLAQNDAQRVGVLMLNHPAYVAIALGTWRAGGVLTPVNARFGVEEVRHVFEDATVDAVFAGAALINRAQEAAADTPVEHVGEVIEDLADPDGAPRATRFDEDEAVLMHTSGTTGDPKAVVQTHRNISAQVDAGIAQYALSSADRAVIPVPLFHVGGLHVGTLAPLFAGGSIALQSFWNATEWARYVEAIEATFTGLIPAMMMDILETDATREFDTSTLELCFYGGSPATESLLQEFEETFGIDHLLALYGQTECAGVTVTYEADESRRPGALGKPIPAVEARLVDLDTGEPIDGVGEGELWLRGDTVGRYADPARNEATFTDGWFQTGDVVRRDADAYLHFVDRADDMILSGGEKVSPTAVEDVLQELDGVQAVAVLGTPHERFGEAVTAAIVRSDASLSAAAVHTFCEQRPDLADYKKPRRIAFLDELPRTATQKVDKASLADELEH